MNRNSIFPRSNTGIKSLVVDSCETTELAVIDPDDGTEIMTCNQEETKINNDLTITGNLSIIGSTINYNVDNVYIKDNLVKFAYDNNLSNIDVGWYFPYGPSQTLYGMLYDNLTSQFKIFGNISSSDPTTTLFVDDSKLANFRCNNINSLGLITANNLSISGSLSTADQLIRIASSNTSSDLVDSGFYTTYNSSGIKYAGLIRKAGGGWMLYKNYTSDPDVSPISTTTYDDLIVNKISVSSSSGITSISGDLLINSATSNINFNGKNVYGISGLTASSITTSSGALSINPTTSTNFNSKPIYSISKIGVGTSNVPENSTNRVVMTLRGFQSSSSSPGIEMSVNTSVNPYLNMFVHSSTLSALQFSSYWDGTNYKRSDATNIPVILRHLGTGLRISSAAASTADSNITWTDNVIFDNSGGLKFGTDANQSYLTAYESSTTNLTMGISIPGTSITVKYQRVGNLVSLTIPAFNAVTTGVGRIYTTDALPTRLRPTADVYQSCQINNAGTQSASGFAVVYSTGVIEVARNNFLDFGSGAACGLWAAITISFLI